VLVLKTKKELAQEAFTLAQSFNLVRYRSVTYIPADFETRETSDPPDIDRTIWLPLSRHQLRLLAAVQFDTLFGTDAELAAFDFMVAQQANPVEKTVCSLLVRTPAGLKELGEDGLLVDPTGDFRPNTLVPMLNEDQAEKDRVFAVVQGWLNSDVEAESLLCHLATCLAPGWSAVKYVLLLGEGRNGKSVMLKMLQGLFGVDNVSNVTRQAMSEKSAVVTELNGKLLNIIYDGQAAYVKDSGTEKSLIAGEPAPIRRLYESTATMVATNALFIEGLNHEPKTSDKSMALQRRLVRFQFPNVYELDHVFERSMLTEPALGAFLSLLIDRYVKEDEVALRLAPTARTIELGLEQVYANSPGLQFLRYLEESDALGVNGILGESMSKVVARFQSWRTKENDLGSWAEPEVKHQLDPLVNTERKTQRVNGKPRKVRVVTSLKYEAAAYIESLKGTDDETLIDTVVDEGDL
jgi:hypothetical protein